MSDSNNRTPIPTLNDEKRAAIKIEQQQLMVSAESVLKDLSVIFQDLLKCNDITKEIEYIQQNSQFRDAANKMQEITSKFTPLNATIASHTRPNKSTAEEYAMIQLQMKVSNQLGNIAARIVQNMIMSVQHQGTQIESKSAAPSPVSLSQFCNSIVTVFDLCATLYKYFMQFFSDATICTTMIREGGLKSFAAVIAWGFFLSYNQQVWPAVAEQQKVFSPLYRAVDLYVILVSAVVDIGVGRLMGAKQSFVQCGGLKTTLDVLRWVLFVCSPYQQQIIQQRLVTSVIAAQNGASFQMHQIAFTLGTIVNIIYTLISTGRMVKLEILVGGDGYNSGDCAAALVRCIEVGIANMDLNSSSKDIDRNAWNRLVIQVMECIAMLCQDSSGWVTIFKECRAFPLLATMIVKCTHSIMSMKDTSKRNEGDSKLSPDAGRLMQVASMALVSMLDSTYDTMQERLIEELDLKRLVNCMCLVSGVTLTSETNPDTKQPLTHVHKKFIVGALDLVSRIVDTAPHFQAQFAIVDGPEFVMKLADALLREFTTDDLGQSVLTAYFTCVRAICYGDAETARALFLSSRSVEALFSKAFEVGLTFEPKKPSDELLCVRACQAMTNLVFGVPSSKITYGIELGFFEKAVQLIQRNPENPEIVASSLCLVGNFVMNVEAMDVEIAEHDMYSVLYDVMNGLALQYPYVAQLCCRIVSNALSTFGYPCLMEIDGHELHCNIVNFLGIHWNSSDSFLEECLMTIAIIAHSDETIRQEMVSKCNVIESLVNVFRQRPTSSAVVVACSTAIVSFCVPCVDEDLEDGWFDLLKNHRQFRSLGIMKLLLAASKYEDESDPSYDERVQAHADMAYKVLKRTMGPIPSAKQSSHDAHESSEITRSKSMAAMVGGDTLDERERLGPTSVRSIASLHSFGTAVVSEKLEDEPESNTDKKSIHFKSFLKKDGMGPRNPSGSNASPALGGVEDIGTALTSLAQNLKPPPPTGLWNRSMPKFLSLSAFKKPMVNIHGEASTNVDAVRLSEPEAESTPIGQDPSQLAQLSSSTTAGKQKPT